MKLRHEFRCYETKQSDDLIAKIIRATEHENQDLLVTLLSSVYRKYIFFIKLLKKKITLTQIKAHTFCLGQI